MKTVRRFPLSVLLPAMAALLLMISVMVKGGSATADQFPHTSESSPVAFVNEVKFDIHGRVTDSQGNANQLWRVQAIRPDDRVADEVPVDAMGVFQIRPLPAAPYQLQVVGEHGRALSLSPNSDNQVWPEMAMLTTAHPRAYHLVVQAVDEAPLSIQGGGQITGVVTAADTALPLSSIYVQAYTVDGNFSTSNFTNSQGQYTLTGLADGAYNVQFDDFVSPYLAEWYDDQPTQASATPITLMAGATISNINAALDRGGQITGTVTDAATGLPIEGVWVTAYATVLDENGCIQEATSVRTDFTDANGVYTLQPLPSNTYRLFFRAYSGTAAHYLDEYYNDKPDLASADPLVVTAPAVISNIDAALVKGGQISGQITAADTTLPLDDVSVYAYDSDGSYVDSASANASGVYTITKLVSGDYRLSFEPSGIPYLQEYYDNKSDMDTADPIHVNISQTVTDKDAVLARGGQISGQVTADDTGLPLEYVSIAIYDSDGRTVDYAYPESDGSYITAGLVSGSYRLRFDPYYLSEAYMREYYNDKTTFGTADPITLTAPALVSGIDAALALGGQITGVVTAESTGLPLEDVYVVAYQASGGSAASDYTEVNGEYALMGLPTDGFRIYFRATVPIYFDCSTDSYSVWEYYDDTTDFGTADIVNVTAPNTVSNINAALPVPAGRIDKHVFLPLVQR